MVRLNASVNCCVWIAAAAGSAWSCAARAQWSVSYLNPEAGSNAQIYASFAGTQVGECRSANFQGACYWKGTAASCTTLHYPGHMSNSQAFGVSETHQVGWATNGIYAHAAMWSGTAESYVDLHPAGSWPRSYAKGVSGDVQVGYVRDSVRDVSHACMWSGSAASWVDLSPSWADTSFANSIRGDQIVGQTKAYQFGAQAALWSASTGQYTNLGYGISQYSEALATDGQYQAGWAVPFYDAYRHASLWEGSVDSWIDLHPSDGPYVESRLYAVSGGVQAGTVDTHAAVWFGTPDSMVDLHAFLPPSLDRSSATGIERDDHNLYVFGFARDPSTNMAQAICWSMPIPASGAAAPLVLAAMFGVTRARRR